MEAEAESERELDAGVEGLDTLWPVVACCSKDRAGLPGPPPLLALVTPFVRLDSLPAAGESAVALDAACFWEPSSPGGRKSSRIQPMPQGGCSAGSADLAGPKVR